MWAKVGKPVGNPVCGRWSGEACPPPVHRVVHRSSEASPPVAGNGHRPHIHRIARERSDRAAATGRVVGELSDQAR
jgi:hypothetical protein